MARNSLRPMIFTLLLLPVPALHADILTLRSGETIEGKVLEETSTEVRIETKVSNIRTTKTYRRGQVKKIEYRPLPDDFWESGRRPKDAETTTPVEPEEADAIDDADEPESTEDTGPHAHAKPDPADRYVVVPIEGGIGQAVTAHGVRAALLQAKNRGAGHVVFTVDSPGGYVYEAVQILEVLKEFDADLEYHCLITEGAISAASVFAAGSDRIFVRPDARLGGAVAYGANHSTGAAEVDAKFNSIWAAEVAARADAKGHLGDVFRAMIVLEAELWQGEDGRLSASRPQGNPAQVDGPSTILTIRAAQMVKAGMATPHEGDASTMGAVLGRPAWSELRGVGARAMTTAARERADLQRRYDEAVAAIGPAADAYKANDPRQFSYRILRYETGVYELGGNSMREWQARSDRAISACDTMLACLKELASVNSKAERTKALHLFTPKDLGHDFYVTVEQNRRWLADHRNNPPAREMARP